MAPMTAASPVFSPAAGLYASAQTVTLSDATAGAGIYYTTNGTAPTSAATKYSGPFTVSASTTVGAVGVAAGYANSPVVYATYSIAVTAATPTFSVAAGAYTSGQAVALSDTTSGAKIYYTTYGTTPTAASTLYSSAISVSANETISAIAVAAGFSNSTVAVATYSIVPAAAASATVVNLASVFNSYAIFNRGTAPTHGGLDGSSYAYAGAGLPSSISLGGVAVTLGPVAAADAVSNKSVALPAGQFGGIRLLASATYGPVSNATFVVTYSDGTTAKFTQNMSDWGYPQSYTGETSTVSDANRITPQGTLQAGLWYMYGYNIALSNLKTVSSLALPQTITFAAVAAQKVGTPLALAATSTSSLAVSYASSTTGVCTVSGSTASFLAAGTCSITASQVGNSTYSAATPVTQSFGVR